MCPALRSDEVLAEPLHGGDPGLLRGRGVVAIRVRVVVEGMVHARIDRDRVWRARLLELLLHLQRAARDAGVELRVYAGYRGLRLGELGVVRGLRAVERHGRLHVGGARGDDVPGLTTAEAEAGHADGAARLRLEERDRRVVVGELRGDVALRERGVVRGGVGEFRRAAVARGQI